jgi:hypothetical protein
LHRKEKEIFLLSITLIPLEPQILASVFESTSTPEVVEVLHRG